MQAPGPSIIGLLALLALLSWRAYKRFKRMVGRQRLSNVRPWITLTVFPLLTLLLAYGARAQLDHLGWMAAGVAAGALLAVYGLRQTRYEPTPKGLFTPRTRMSASYCRSSSSSGSCTAWSSSMSIPRRRETLL